MKTTASLPIVSIKASDDNPNVYRIAAAKAGSASYGPNGRKFHFTEESLIANAASWVGGTVTLNHNRVDEGSKIIASEYDPVTKLVYQDIEVVVEETSRRVRAGEPTGVSIEADVFDVDDEDNILTFGGTGVSVIFYPDMPACPLKDGCGVLSKEQYTDKVATISASRAEKITAKNYDLARINNEGLPVKIDTIVMWETDTDKEEASMLANFVGWHGPGTYQLFNESDMAIGDIVSGETGPVKEVSISVETISSTPGGDNITPNPEVVSKEEFDKVVAQLKDAREALSKAEASEKTKDLEAKIAASEAEKLKLQEKIDAFESIEASKLVEEIKAADAEYDPIGKNLADIQRDHAFFSRISASVKASIPEVKVSANEFQAPSGNYAGMNGSAGFTLGGIVNGKYVGSGSEIGE